MIVKEIKDIDYHRNGVSGEGFYVVSFVGVPDGSEENMLAVVFPELDEDGYVTEYTFDSWGNPRIAVLSVDRLPDVEFARTAWRGDHFIEEIAVAIAAFSRAPYDLEADRARHARQVEFARAALRETT